VRLSVNVVAGGRLWVAGQEVPEEIIPEHARRYILNPEIGSSADPGDVPAAVRDSEASLEAPRLVQCNSDI
jgi:hypothetical protein